MSSTGSGSSPQSQSQSQSSSPHDDWRRNTNPVERRRIQNRISQRIHRAKLKTQREAELRREYDERMAGSAYSAPDPTHMNHEQESGLPWGSFPIRRTIELGRARDQQEQQQRISLLQHQNTFAYMNQSQQHHSGHDQLQQHQQEQHLRQHPQQQQYHHHHHYQHLYVPSPAPRAGASSR